MGEKNFKTNFCVVSADREELINVVDCSKYDFDREDTLNAARKIRDGWFNTMDKVYVIVEVPRERANMCNAINNVNGFHQYPRAA